MSTLFNRAALLAAVAVQTTETDVPDVGIVRLKSLSVAEVDDARQRAKAGAATDFGLCMLAYSLVDDAGAQLFDIFDLTPLRAASGTKVDALVSAALVVNGFKLAGATSGN